MRRKSDHWIRHTHLFRSDEYECSACGFLADKLEKGCPNCGMPMKSAEYDPSWGAIGGGQRQLVRLPAVARRHQRQDAKHYSTVLLT